MINEQKLYSIALVSATLILMLISITNATPFANIKNNNDNTTSVPNPANNTITATINVGRSPNGEIAISQDGTKVYVTDSGTFDIPGNTVSVIDTSTNTVEATN